MCAVIMCICGYCISAGHPSCGKAAAGRVQSVWPGLFIQPSLPINHLHSAGCLRWKRPPDFASAQDVPPMCTHGGENTRSLTCEDNVSGWIYARLPRGCIPVAEFDIFIYHWRAEVQGSHLSGLQISDLLSFDLFWLPSILTWITNFVNFLKCCLNKDWLNGWGSQVNPNPNAVCVGWRATSTGPGMAMKIILFLESSDHSSNQVNRIIWYIYVCVIGLTQPDSPMDLWILASNLIQFVLFDL